LIVDFLLKAKVSSLGELANLRQQFEKVYQFLKEAELISNLDELISNAQLVLQHVHSNPPRFSFSSHSHNRTQEINHSSERSTTNDTSTLRPDSSIRYGYGTQKC
jgi:hypothetical protein